MLDERGEFKELLESIKLGRMKSTTTDKDIKKIALKISSAISGKLYLELKVMKKRNVYEISLIKHTFFGSEDLEFAKLRIIENTMGALSFSVLPQFNFFDNEHFRVKLDTVMKIYTKLIELLMDINDERIYQRFIKVNLSQLYKSVNHLDLYLTNSEKLSNRVIYFNQEQNNNNLLIFRKHTDVVIMKELMVHTSLTEGYLLKGKRSISSVTYHSASQELISLITFKENNVTLQINITHSEDKKHLSIMHVNNDAFNSVEYYSSEFTDKATLQQAVETAIESCQLLILLNE